MIIRLVAYGCLGLAILNTAEIIGLVEPGRYLSGLPRWDITSFSPAARQWIGHAGTGVGMAKSGYAMAQNLGSQMSDGVYLPDALPDGSPNDQPHYPMDPIPAASGRAPTPPATPGRGTEQTSTQGTRPGGLHFSRTTLSGAPLPAEDL